MASKKGQMSRRQQERKAARRAGVRSRRLEQREAARLAARAKRERGDKTLADVLEDFGLGTDFVAVDTKHGQEELAKIHEHRAAKD